ncbi:MAG: ketoacyl-ACP synthase III [Oscillospiraceae bacterium]|nr:ketoacyl-ACP synthase III [Oscillospiraceae bacterium]
MSFRILGTGSYLPKRSVYNDELSQFIDTSDEWIQQRVGISSRPICTTETTADMAYNAALGALEMSGVSPSELDMILCATVSADYAAPSLACSLQSMLGATCPAMDINAACSGFIYTLETAAAFFGRGLKRILVVGAERLSRVVDWSDRSTAVIFADGAGAMMLGDGDTYISSKLCAKGDAEVLCIPSFAGTSPYYEVESKKPYVHMNGQEVFKFAVNAMCTDLADVVAAAGLKIDDIAWIIPHQANARIIDAAVRKLDLKPERCLKNIETTGNTSAASVAILADELFRSGKLKDGDYIVMAAFGAGLTSAACVIRWGGW